jgi:hypothetical protein
MDINTRRELPPIELQQEARGLKFSANGKSLAAIGGIVTIWDPSTARKQCDLSVGDAVWSRCSLDEDGRIWGCVFARFEPNSTATRPFFRGWKDARCAHSQPVGK